jgi:hypothetical protein
LAHVVKVDVEPALVLAERRVAVGVARDPRAHGGAERGVADRRAVQLVGERAEEAVAVAERRRGVQPERAKLLVQPRRVRGGVGGGECLRGRRRA